LDMDLYSGLVLFPLLSMLTVLFRYLALSVTLMNNLPCV
jgi:hypothetical protein